jgi:multidrug resistance protein
MKRGVSAVLFTSVLVDTVGFGIVIPVLPFYATEFGATPFEVTVLFAAFSAMQMVTTPVWGRFSDRHGRRPLFIAGLFASALSHLVFGLATSLWLLFVSRIAAGAAGGTISIAHAYIADTTTAEDRAHHMGLVGAAAGLGFMLGPALGGFVSHWDLSYPGYVAAALAAGNAISAYFLLPESRSREVAARGGAGEAATTRGLFRTLTRPPISLMMGVYFLSISSFTGMTALLALFLEDRFALDAGDVGLVFTLAGGATVVMRGLFLGVLVRRHGEKAVVRMGAGALFLALAILPLLPNAWWMLLDVPLFAFGAGALFPTLATLVSFATDEHSQGAVLGGSQVVGGLGRVTGPLWFGLLFQNVGVRSPFIAGALLLAASWALAGRIPSQTRPRRPPVSPVAEEMEAQSLQPE